MLLFGGVKIIRLGGVFLPDRLSELKLKIQGVEALRIMKSLYSYEELAALTGLPPQTLARYVSGHFLPALDRARRFLELLRDVVLRKAISESIDLAGSVVVDVKLISNIGLLAQLAKVIASEFSGEAVTKVLTKEADGIPLATLVAKELQAKLVIAKQRKELGVDSFIEVKQIYPTGVYNYVYVPRELLSRRDRVLIVDDIIRSGSTVEALIEACRTVRAEVVGVYAILAIRRGIRRLRRRYNVPIRTLLELDLETS